MCATYEPIVSHNGMSERHWPLRKVLYVFFCGSRDRTFQFHLLKLATSSRQLSEVGGSGKRAKCDELPWTGQQFIILMGMLIRYIQVAFSSAEGVIYVCVCRYIYIYITILVLTTIFLFSNFTIQIPKRCKDHSSNRSYLGPGQHVGWVHQHIGSFHWFRLGSVAFHCLAIFWVCNTCPGIIRLVIPREGTVKLWTVKPTEKDGESQEDDNFVYMTKKQLVTWWFHQACKHEWTPINCLHQQQLFSTTSQQQFVHMANPFAPRDGGLKIGQIVASFHPALKRDEIQGPAV